MSAEGATHTESEHHRMNGAFQRCNFTVARIPGALPQARLNSAPSALQPMGAARESDEAAVWEGDALLARR
jgi:hypothetical protein